MSKYGGAQKGRARVTTRLETISEPVALRTGYSWFNSPVAFPTSCIAVATPAWLNDRDQIDYATTKKGEPFKNASEVVSRKSVAALVVKLATTPGLEIHSSLGVHQAS